MARNPVAVTKALAEGDEQLSRMTASEFVNTPAAGADTEEGADVMNGAFDTLIAKARGLPPETRAQMSTYSDIQYLSGDEDTVIEDPVEMAIAMSNGQHTSSVRRSTKELFARVGMDDIDESFANIMTRTQGGRLAEAQALASIPLEAFAELLAQGNTFPQIAKALGLSNWVVTRYAYALDVDGELCKAADMGAHAIVAYAWERLRTADPESKGAAMAAKGISDFAQWYAERLAPSAFRPRNDDIAHTPTAENHATVHINVSSQHETNAQVVGGSSTQVIDSLLEDRFKDLPFDVELAADQ